jgi:cardiolipin synthase
VLAASSFGFELGVGREVAVAAVAALTGLSAAAYLAAWTRHMAS